MRKIHPPRHLIRLCLAWVMLPILCAIGYAQFDTATVLGTVQDSNGAIITGAKVTLKNTATGVTATTQTDANGNYQFFNVKIGEYQVTAEMQGFSKASAEK